MIDFGSAIRFLRIDRGLTQEELAEITGFTQVYISMVETKKFYPGLPFIANLCDHLEIPMEYALARTIRFKGLSSAQKHIVSEFENLVMAKGGKVKMGQYKDSHRRRKRFTSPEYREKLRLRERVETLEVRMDGVETGLEKVRKRLKKERARP